VPFRRGRRTRGGGGPSQVGPVGGERGVDGGGVRSGIDEL